MGKLFPAVPSQDETRLGVAMPFFYCIYLFIYFANHIADQSIDNPGTLRSIRPKLVSPDAPILLLDVLKLDLAGNIAG